MKNIKKYELEWGGKPLAIEFNRYAGQTNGSCTVQYGDTMVLVTAVMSESVRGEIDYFPLMVEFQESMSAAGKISGSRFIKREGRPSDQAMLSARIIDRCIRPLFTNTSIRNDIQVTVSVLSYDPSCDPDIAGLIGASAALTVSDIPWAGPLGGCVVTTKDGEMKLNPSAEEVKEADLNVFVSGRDMETIMLEADGSEASEDAVYNSIEFGLKEIEPVIELINKIGSEIGLEKRVMTDPELTAEQLEMKKVGEEAAVKYFAERGSELFGPGNKREQAIRMSNANLALKEAFTEEQADAAKFAVKHLDFLFQEAMIKRIFADGKRVDDRGIEEIREINVEAGGVPRVHGSGMFSRGDTQILSVATLSSPSNEQILDTMRHDEKRNYFHHYSFPPFSVGEARPMRGPGRREIGHGALAEKALVPVLPAKSEFPYTIRVRSDVLSSNGSSSQGSICGSTLCLMDAGVPIKSPVAGIAMGLALNGEGNKEDYKILTDIQDVEDHEESMDFKVAGTKEGVTAVQLDIKLDGITLDMVRDTLEKAKTARLELLEKMTAVIPEPRAELSEYAPKIKTIQINPLKIGELIGPGGKVINGIIEKTGVEIDIEETGLVYVTTKDNVALAEALEIIEGIVKEIQPGEVYKGKILKIITDRNNVEKEIGAIVQLTPNQDGMVHISEIAQERINKVSDVVKEGEVIEVKVLEVDSRTGRISLSRKALLGK
ncbi:MAG: polyribonucleotide nucleotidyltransferase [bacterium]|nr:polyribonucleotide nucleotidyltransferase [bacterium]